MNWKTTLLGLGAVLTVIGTALTAVFDGDTATTINVSTLITGIVTGIGLILAKDGDK